MATLAHPLEILPVLEPIDRVLCSEEEAVARAHRAAPLLVARRDHVREGAAPQFLVAVEEGRDALALVRYAAMLAAGCGGYVHLAHVRGPAYGPAGHAAPARRALAGGDLDHRRRAHRRRAAARSLGCVSEALVRDAPCSVLVVPAS